MTHTVYFDTSFYVRLQRTLQDDKIDEALRLIDALRDRKIRRVESMELALELSAGTDHAQKGYLIDLLYRWDPEPYQINGVNLAVICVGNRFDDLGAVMRERAAMFALSAHLRTLLPRPTGPISNEDRQRAQTMGAEMANLVASHPYMPEFARSIFLELKVLLEAGLDEDATRLAMKDLQRRLQHFAEEEMPGFSFIEEVRKEVLASNLRPTLIVEERASAKVERNHRATILDLDHLSVFQRNLDSIDWLMMDTPQLAALDQWTKSQVSGFRQRIFVASSLRDVIPALDTLIAGSMGVPRPD